MFRLARRYDVVKIDDVFFFDWLDSFFFSYPFGLISSSVPELLDFPTGLLAWSPYVSLMAT